MTVTLHPSQSKLLRSNKRFTVFCGGTGSGKSFVGPLKVMHWVSQKPGCICIVCAPTFSILESASVPNLLAHLDNAGWVYTFQSQKNKLLLADGSVIYLRSMDNANSIQGIVVTGGIWYDEAFMGTAAAWQTVRQRTTFARSPIVLTSTPYGPGWSYDLIQKAKAGDPDIEYIGCRSIDNPYFDLDEYHRAQKDFPPAIFNMLYNGEFGAPENAVCPDFSAENIRDSIYDPTKELIIGSDFNVNPLCSCIMQKHGDEIRVIDEIVIKHNARTQDLLDELYRRYSNHTKGFWFCGDATSQSRHTSASDTDYIQIAKDERFIALGRHLRYPEKNPGVVDRVNTINALIKNTLGEIRFYVDKKCIRLIQDLQQARYLEGTRVVDKKSYDPHSLDACSYATFQLAPVRMPITKSVIFTRKFQER